MSTLSAYGMGPGGFRVNRPLNEYEQVHHFNLRKSASQQVHYDLSLIHFNSTFVECVDKWYAMRGFVAMAGAGFGFAALFGIFATLYGLYMLGEWIFLLPLIMLLPLLWFVKKLIFSDAFTYTHYPIRFNRKNRQVYAFRRDGTVLKAGWDELYWTIYNTKIGLGGGDLNVMGHLLDKDGVTVKESIALSLVDAGEPGRQNLLMFFEFFRRYMEEGPGPVLEALKPTPLIMLPPIDRQRESWWFGWELLTAGLKGMPLLQLLFQVFFLPMSLFRWIVMRTSKIPRWPQWVEDECRIEPGDPWRRDPGYRDEAAIEAYTAAARARQR